MYPKMRLRSECVMIEADLEGVGVRSLNFMSVPLRANSMTLTEFVMRILSTSREFTQDPEAIGETERDCQHVWIVC